MKKLTALLACVTALTLCGAQKLPFSIDPKIPRKINVGDKALLALTPGKFEIVEGANNYVIKFAATEMAEALSAVMGCQVKPVRKSSGKAAVEICIGDEKLAAELGIDTKTFDRDGFIIRTVKNKILIIGRDNPKSSPLRDAHNTGNKGEWGTLYGVYDFLERFAGVRYYFPGRLGTHYPEAKSLAIPAIDIYERPDFLQRRFTDYNHGGRPIRRYEGWDGRRNKLRTRMETIYIPNCHGIAYLGYPHRFGKTHPEYFALNVNGKRMMKIGKRYDESQVCFSSGIRQELVADAISFLKNEPASVRGIKNRLGNVTWNNVHRPGLPCFNIMPNDAAYLCRCPECWKHFSKGKQATTDYFWSFFSDICAQVKKSGVPGYLTTMAYADYRMSPTQPIPDNLLVMLAIRGPWNEYLSSARDSDVELLKAWKKKLGQKTWLWTYPGKYNGNMPGIPHTTPRALASFIKRVTPYIFGIFIECESDVLMHNYLTYHVFGKLAWNTETDVEKLLEEHVTLFYGPAARPMKEFFDSIERNWAKIAAHVVETSLGPQTIFPSELVLWSKIYSPEELKRLNGLFDQAEKLVAKDKLRLERIRFVRKEFMEPLLGEAQKFTSANDAVKAWSFPVNKAEKAVKIDGKLDDEVWKKAPAFHLSGLLSAPAQVSSIARMSYDKDNYYFGFEWAEPLTDKIAVSVRKHDDTEMWKDSTAEVFISPDGDREHYYQILLNSRGDFNDVEVNRGTLNYKWESRAEVKTSLVPGKGWYAEIRVPRNSMRKSAPDGVRVNFARYRSLTGMTGHTDCYTWSPFIRKFGEVSRFGKVLFEAPAQSPNLLWNPELIQEKKRTPGWGFNKIKSGDSEVFMTGGSSVKFDASRTSSSIYQYLPQLQPNKDYEVTFFAKLDNVKKRASQWSGFYSKLDLGNGTPLFFPPAPVQMDGSCNWTGFKFHVRTPSDVGKKSKPYLSFIFREADGFAWVDHISVREIKK